MLVNANKEIDRRDFLRSSLVSAAAVPILANPAAGIAAAAAPQPQADPPGIIDTNVHLFDWPFRRLKYGQTAALIAKLKKHRVVEAWAGSFEALLHKNLDTVNRRLAEECQQQGRGFLVPVGSVCPAWPGWEEDLRRCHEAYHMPGIRLYPGYHNYRLDLPEFAALLDAAVRRGLFVQIAMELEDARVHHPALNVATVVAAPLTEVLKKVPQARVQLLNGLTALQQGGAQQLVSETSVTLDIGNLEGAGAVGRLIDGKHWSIKTQVPLPRLMFGSHAPFFPFEAALLRLFESPLEREQLTAIMHENARHWLAPGGTRQ